MLAGLRGTECFRHVFVRMTNFFFFFFFFFDLACSKQKGSFTFLLSFLSPTLVRSFACSIAS
jgi:hypothetical protein